VLADERTRIARELHTVVASNVSAMVIQAEAAELLLDDDFRAADEAMAAVERTGRDALSDMRRMLGVLRQSGDATPLAPQPGVGELYGLVEAARTKRQGIELSVEGEPGPLPSTCECLSSMASPRHERSCPGAATGYHAC
jgi:signal transduction histidine kinase